MPDDHSVTMRSAIRQVAAALADDDVDAAALDQGMCLHLLGDESCNAVSLREAGRRAGVNYERIRRLKPRFMRAIKAAFPVRAAA